MALFVAGCRYGSGAGALSAGPVAASAFAQPLPKAPVFGASVGEVSASAGSDHPTSSTPAMARRQAVGTGFMVLAL